MNLVEIYDKFNDCKSWEERYRLLIQLSRLLPKPSEEELVLLPEIEGCESRLWFQFQCSPRKVVAYSDARLMQGILMIVVTALDEKSEEELRDIDLKTIFDELKISPNLTSTRLNGLSQIQKQIKC
ncbi:SufE family protein [Mannheimia sp. AT1]|uniref:SufE family protein n=1 Tax=Mannheimia cairinae TaxID=3025936 RepID=A0ABT5MQZ4_9PAST|nr:SufE family protein [Mannheimia cairinae]MDD0823268.1 SufE family protein [Mannheimia cairinae]MDD0825706.1 SufE family protein [Mannheimia cairinae]